MLRYAPAVPGEDADDTFARRGAHQLGFEDAEARMKLVSSIHPIPQTAAMASFPHGGG